MKNIVLPIIAFSTLAACQAVPTNKSPHYWERANITQTSYIRGPQAQNLLNKNIAQCVTELRELERLGQIKNAMPADPYESIDNLEELERLEWDYPERDGVLLAEHKDYHNFRDCMKAKGWKRTSTVSYEARLRAEDNYNANHVSSQSHHDSYDAEHTHSTSLNE